MHRYIDKIKCCNFILIYIYMYIYIFKLFLILIKYKLYIYDITNATAIWLWVRLINCKAVIFSVLKTLRKYEEDKKNKRR